MSATESPKEIVERLQWEREPRPPLLWCVVAVTGGRDFQPTREHLRRFWQLFDEVHGSELHHGDCGGVDKQVALNAANTRPGLRVVAHPADWRPDGPSGRLDRSAGPKRNERMMALCTVLIAFPGGRGTNSCLRIARRAGRRILYVVPPES